MLKKLNLNLIILSILIAFSSLIPRELLAHSAVSSVHMHMSQYTEIIPENCLIWNSGITLDLTLSD